MGTKIDFPERDYSIMVGAARGGDAMRGSLERTNSDIGTISTTIKGLAVPVPPMVGDEWIPNRTMVWGRRLIKGAVKEGEQPISVSDPAYTGEIELMQYGSIGGYPIVLRYIESSPTLDYDYQVTKLGMAKYNTEESKETDYMLLPMGENVINTLLYRNKALFLKVHHLNDNSPCKMPSAYGSAMRDIIMLDNSEQEASASDKEFEAGKLVREADSYTKVKALNDIVGKGEVIYDEKDQNSLFSGLKVFAKSEPNKVIDRWAAYKANISNLFSKFDAFNALDAGKPGVIALGVVNKKVLNFTSLPDKIKGEEVGVWVLQNLLNDEVQHLISEMEIISEKLK